MPKPVLVLNRWHEGMDISLGEELYGLRAACVIPEIREIPEAERYGMPAVLGCQLFYRILSELSRQVLN